MFTHAFHTIQLLSTITVHIINLYKSLQKHTFSLEYFCRCWEKHSMHAAYILHYYLLFLLFTKQYIIFNCFSGRNGGGVEKIVLSRRMVVPQGGEAEKLRKFSLKGNNCFSSRRSGVVKKIFLSRRIIVSQGEVEKLRIFFFQRE